MTQEIFDGMVMYLGGHIKLKRYIRYKTTPHSIPIRIYEIKEGDKLEDYGEAASTVLQRLRWLTYLKQEHESNEDQRLFEYIERC